MRTRTTRLEQQHAARKRERFYSQSRWLNRVRKQVLYNAGYRCAAAMPTCMTLASMRTCTTSSRSSMHPAWASTCSISKRYARIVTTRSTDVAKYGCDVDGTPLDPIIRGMRYVELDRVPSRISN